MKRIYDSTLGCMVAIDGIIEKELDQCHNLIKIWKKTYFRKSRKSAAHISMRCYFPGLMPEFWKYHLEIWSGGKMIDSERICKEAYDVLKRDKECTEHPNVEFVKLAIFEPAAAPVEVVKVKKQKLPTVKKSHFLIDIIDPVLDPVFINHPSEEPIKEKKQNFLIDILNTSDSELTFNF